MVFGCLSLVETGVVLFLFHQKAQDWHDLISADRITKLLRRLVCRKKQPETALEIIKIVAESSGGRSLRCSWTCRTTWRSG